MGKIKQEKKREKKMPFFLAQTDSEGEKVSKKERERQRREG